MTQVDNINATSLRPLRRPAGVTEPVARFTIDDLKKGINITTGSAPGDEKSPAIPSIPAIESLTSPTVRTLSPLNPLDNLKSPGAPRSRNSDLTEAQKVEQLKKIKKSAEDYEGLLMAEMIKSMRQSPLTKEPGNDTYSEIAEKPFTALLTAAGGLGLSESIVNQIAAKEGLASTLSDHPEIMGANWHPKISPSRMQKPVQREQEPGDTGARPTEPKSGGTTDANTGDQISRAG